MVHVIPMRPLRAQYPANFKVVAGVTVALDIALTASTYYVFGMQTLSVKETAKWLGLAQMVTASISGIAGILTDQMISCLQSQSMFKKSNTETHTLNSDLEKQADIESEKRPLLN